LWKGFRGKEEGGNGGREEKVKGEVKKCLNGLHILTPGEYRGNREIESLFKGFYFELFTLNSLL